MPEENNNHKMSPGALWAILASFIIIELTILGLWYNMHQQPRCDDIQKALIGIYNDMTDSFVALTKSVFWIDDVHAPVVVEKKTAGDATSTLSKQAHWIINVRKLLETYDVLEKMNYSQRNLELSYAIPKVLLYEALDKNLKIDDVWNEMEPWLTQHREFALSTGRREDSELVKYNYFMEGTVRLIEILTVMDEVQQVELVNKANIVSRRFQDAIDEHCKFNFSDPLFEKALTGKLFLWETMYSVTENQNYSDSIYDLCVNVSNNSTTIDQTKTIDELTLYFSVAEAYLWYGKIEVAVPILKECKDWCLTMLERNLPYPSRSELIGMQSKCSAWLVLSEMLELIRNNRGNTKYVGKVKRQNILKQVDNNKYDTLEYAGSTIYMTQGIMNCQFFMLDADRHQCADTLKALKNNINKSQETSGQTSAPRLLNDILKSCITEATETSYPDPFSHFLEIRKED